LLKDNHQFPKLPGSSDKDEAAEFSSDGMDWGEDDKKDDEKEEAALERSK
jgi:hypothetical protein